MITEHDLQEAIAECEGQRNPTSSTCLKLAAYYTIRDQLFPQPTTDTQSESSARSNYSYMSQQPTETIQYNGETEFGKLIDGAKTTDVMAIIDDLMSTLQMISPRLYSGVIRQLSEL